MASASEIADRAMALAEGFLSGSRDELAGMASDDGSVLYDASQLVRGRANSGAPTAHSAEHLAFSLITAAHELIRTRGPAKGGGSSS